MPKLAPHANPKLCHHKATGRAVVALNGREFYCGDFGSPAARRKYDRLIAEWTGNGRVPLATESDLSLIEVLAAFKQHAKEYYADRDGSLMPNELRKRQKGETKQDPGLYQQKHLARF